MVYGDDPINLHAYTYKPQSTAIAQAGNLYFYAINNPVAYQDASGESSLALSWGASTWGFTLADGPLPIGDAIYIGGIIVLGVVDGVMILAASKTKGKSEKKDEKAKKKNSEKDKSKGTIDTPDTAPDKFVKLKHGQGYKDKDGNI